MDIDKIVQEVTRELGSGVKTTCSTFGNPVVECNSAAYSTDIISKLEHSLLNADATRSFILEECTKARKYGFASVCVSPYYVADVAKALQGSSVKVGTAVGFPQAAMSSSAKIQDIKDCIYAGAHEIDVAVNILAVKSGDFREVRRELAEVVEMTRGKVLVKAVYDQGAYNETEKRQVLEMAAEAGCDFAKIQNVFAKKAACVEDVKFVRSIIGNNMGIKIDGGIKTPELCSQLLEAGATRLGLTATVKIAEEILGSK